MISKSHHNAAMTPWEAADKAYQLHHGICATCKAAGMRPGLAERCPDGKALWRAYNDTGWPEHVPYQKPPPKIVGKAPGTYL